MEEKTVQEKMMEDTKKNLDLCLQQMMEIIEPVNFENKYRKRWQDEKWLDEKSGDYAQQTVNILHATLRKIGDDLDISGN